MTPKSDRDAAAERASRVETTPIDPSKADEADRPPSDRPPAFIDALMSEPVSIEKSADGHPTD
jgi:hypothetical protein